MPLINVVNPANVQIFYSIAISLSNFDILPTDAIFSNLLGPRTEEDAPFNDNFEALGYSSM